MTNLIAGELLLASNSCDNPIIRTGNSMRGLLREKLCGGAGLEGLLRQTASDGLTTAIHVEACRLGTLVQDRFRGLLVTLPAPFPVVAMASLLLGQQGVQVEPSSFTKTRAVCEAICHEHAPEAGVAVQVWTQQNGVDQEPPTDAQVASAGAIWKLLGVKPDYCWLARRMAALGSSDGPCSDARVAIWDQVRAERCSPEFALPPAGFVATVCLRRDVPDGAGNSLHLPYTRREHDQLQRIFADLPGVLAALDVETLARFASMSFDINNRACTRPELAILHELRRSGLVLGYFGGHGNRCVGVICEPNMTARVVWEFRQRIGQGYRIVGWRNDRPFQWRPFLLQEPRHEVFT